MYYMGIDPGSQGGIALISSDRKEVSVHKIPESTKDLWLFVKERKDIIVMCSIEILGPRPHQAKLQHVVKSGIQWGELCMAVVAADIPLTKVSPMKWQNVLAIKKPKSNEPIIQMSQEKRFEWEKTRYKLKKTYQKTIAQEMFPKVKVFNWNADALLIAEYCRRTFG
jgi:hypothetical protein